MRTWWTAVGTAVTSVACVACSSPKSPHAAGDAAAGDARADAPTADSAAVLDAAPLSGPLTVTVYGFGGDAQPGSRVVGAHVFFGAADGTTTDVVTGADGVATLEVTGTTTVWVFHREGSTGVFVDAFIGLLPDDSITSGNLQSPNQPPCIGGEPTIDFPTYVGASYYWVTMSCTGGTNGPTPPLPFLSCPRQCDASADGVVVVSGATSSATEQPILSYATLTGIDLSTLTNSTTLEVPALQPAPTMTATFSALPPDTESLTLDTSNRQTGDPTHLSDLTLLGGPAPGSDTATLSATALPFGDSIVLSSDIRITGYGDALFSETVSPIPLAIAVDASTMPHPAKGASYDATAGVLSWSEDTSGSTTPALVFLQLLGAGNSVRYQLRTAHTDAPVVVVPPLPASSGFSIGPSPSITETRIESAVGKTYHDLLVGAAGTGPQWQIAF